MATSAFFCAKFLNDSFLGQNEKKITIFYQNYLWRRSTTTFKHKTFKKSIFKYAKPRNQTSNLEKILFLEQIP
ncbi:MAG: hypothetical protein CFE22_10310 [Cytophagaceae bacterium BCCC1]|nr:MAG: hypothetical protein CFE22_10310 [Cytophagaceae bacterium BCCC1]